MPKAQSLTKRIKTQRTPLILQRDYPDNLEPVCCYCEQRFIENHPLWKRTWEHLNNDNTCEESWNLSWAHWKCNEDKVYSIDFQIIAQEIIKKNKKWDADNDFELSSERENKIDQNIHSEIDLSTTHFQVATEYLAEKINCENYSIPLEDTIYCIVGRCREKTNHGSHQSVRAYLKELTCSEGSYRMDKKEGKYHIFRNNLN